MTIFESRLAWLGLGQGHIGVFAFCLVLGIALGAVSASRVDLSAAAFTLIDDPLSGGNNND